MGLRNLFYPESIAVIGASPSMGSGKLPYLQIMQMRGYPGRLYPVNPKHSEISGLKSYPSIDALPEGIDLMIASVPAEEALAVTRAAARRKVKFLHFFTSGFSEMGNRSLEAELLREAAAGGTRIVGPNCVGIHCAESRVSFTPEIQGDIPKEVAFFGQSGGTTSNFVGMAMARGIGLNKVVSYGNQIDVAVEDYLTYFAGDEKIRVIAGYVEDIKNPRKFLRVLEEATRTKPVVILKGGVTQQGARAAASHTGALASNHTIWSAAIHQHGGVLVDTLEQMVDFVMMAVSKRTPHGPRCGFLGAGGGACVAFTDLATLDGLLLPELQPATQEVISRKIRAINTSTTNPVDLGFYGFDFDVMAHTIRALGRDDRIDVIIPYFSADYITVAEFQRLESGPQTIIEATEEVGNPVIPVLSKFAEANLDVERVRLSLFSSFRKAGLPVYSTIQDLIYATKKYLEWIGRPSRNNQ
ncbi:MAG: CoA-binding protein [Deltaproteobacteria bacterium]|nr:CoA-binding protein [Deltaproteobacteria bacterium]